MCKVSRTAKVQYTWLLIWLQTVQPKPSPSPSPSMLAADLAWVAYKGHFEIYKLDPPIVPS